MANKMRRTTKITIMSIVLALCVSCVAILAVVLTKDSPRFLTASQKAFFNALHTQNVYSSNLLSGEIDLGDTSADSIVTVYDDYVLVKNSSEYDLLSTKNGYAGKSLNLTFDGVVAIKKDVAIFRYNENYFVYKFDYTHSENITPTQKFQNASAAVLKGDLIALFYEADQTLKIVDLNSLEVLLSVDDVIDYSLGENGVTFTKVTDVTSTTAKAQSFAYVLVNGELIEYEKCESEVLISSEPTRYSIDGKYVDITNVDLLRIAGDFLLTQRFAAATAENANFVNTNGKAYVLTQVLKSLVTGKEKVLSDAYYFDTVKSSVDGYVFVVGDKIKADKTPDFNDRVAYYYDKDFELLTSYDFDEFGELIDYRKNIAVAQNGFIDILGQGRDRLNNLLKEYSINSLALTNNEEIVIAKNASYVYVIDIAKVTASKVATTSTTFVDGFMFVASDNGATQEYFLLNNKGETKALTNIDLDESLVAYDKLSTGYYFEKVDATYVNLVKYDGTILMANVNRNSIAYSLSHDKSSVILTMENATDGLKVFRSRLPENAIKPSVEDEIIIYNALANPVASLVADRNVEVVVEKEIGVDYADNTYNFKILSMGENIKFTAYKNYLFEKIEILQMKTLAADIITDIKNNEVGSVGFNYAEFTKHYDNGNLYKATVNLVERSRKIVFNVEQGDTITQEQKTLYYSDVYGGSSYAVPASSKPGYTFTGYTFSYGGAQPTVSNANYLDFSSSAFANYIMPTDTSSLEIALDTPCEFNAKYDANTYTLVFDDGIDGATGSTSQKTVTYGESVTLPGEVYKKTGYRHIGWSKTEGATAVEYQKGESVSNLTTGNYIELYAVWAKNTYTINFDANLDSYDADKAYVKGSTTEYTTLAIDVNIDTALNGIIATNIYLYSNSDGYMFLSGWKADKEGTNAFGNSMFSDVDNSSGQYTAEAIAVAENEAYKWNVYVYASYVQQTTFVDLNITSDSNAANKAFEINTNNETFYNELFAISEFAIGNSQSFGAVNKIINSVDTMLYKGASLTFTLKLNSDATYVKNIKFSIYYGATAIMVEIVGTYNQVTKNVTYSVTNSYTDKVTIYSISANSGEFKIKLNNIDPTYNATTDKVYLGKYSAQIGLKSFGFGETESQATLEKPNMQTNAGTYTYINVYYGRLFKVKKQLNPGEIFARYQLEIANGTSNPTVKIYTFDFAYKNGANELKIHGKEGEVSGGSITYKLDGLSVTVGYNNGYYIEITGQITTDLNFSFETEAVESDVKVVGGGTAGAITIDGRTEFTMSMKPTDSKTIIYSLKPGYRIQAIIVNYGGEVVNFREFDYDNWDKNTGYYATYICDTDFVDAGKLKGTGINAYYNGGLKIDFSNIWFNATITIKYERVSDIIININDKDKVDILHGETSILGYFIKDFDSQTNRYTLRMIGNDEIVNFNVRPEINDEAVYFITGASVSAGTGPITINEKISASWDSLKASVVNINIDKYIAEMTVSTYLGKGYDVENKKAYDPEHIRDGGVYYTFDAINFDYFYNESISKNYGEIWEAYYNGADEEDKNSIVKVVFTGNTFIVELKNTDGDKKGYLIKKFVLKDQNGVVVAEKEDIDGSHTIEFMLQGAARNFINENISKFTLDIYYDAIEYDVIYEAGSFIYASGDMNGSIVHETTLLEGFTYEDGKIKSHHVFNVYKNVYDMVYARDAWIQTGWVKEPYTITRDGKLPETIESKNLTNEPGEVVLYAAWSPVEFTIIYDNKDAEGGVENGTSVAEIVDAGSDTLKYLFAFEDVREIKRNGYKFLGWYVDENVDSEKISNQTLTYALYLKLIEYSNLDPEAQTITVTARWEKIEYRLTSDDFIFNDADDSNGSSDATLIQNDLNYTVTFDTAFGEGLPVLERIGYNFVGWSYAPNGEIIVENETYLYDDLFKKLTGDNRDKKDSTASFNLYAIWEKQPFTLIYDLNNTNCPGNTLDDSGFSATPSSKTVMFDEAFGELAVVSANGYEFKGWYLKPDFSYKNVTGTPVSKETILSMGIWEELYSGSYKLSSKYENGTDTTYTFTLFAYWQIKEVTVSAASNGAEYVNSVDYNSALADKGQANAEAGVRGDSASKIMNYGDFAVIDFEPTTGHYINAITFEYNDTSLVYNINWNSAEQTLVGGTLNLIKTEFVEGIKFIFQPYSEGSDVNYVRVVLTFVKTNIQVKAEEKIQTYEVQFKHGVNSNVLFTTIVNYNTALDQRLFVYPYVHKYEFTNYSLSNKRNNTTNSTYISTLIKFDTIVTMNYKTATAQKVNFYLWNGSAYEKSTISDETFYNLFDGTHDGSTYTLDGSLIPIVDDGGVSVVMGGSGTPIKVTSFKYGGRLLNFPSVNADYYPENTYLAGYVLRSSAPAAGSYYTRNISGKTKINENEMFTFNDMIEKEINLYAVYDKPVFKFNNSVIDTIDEFSVSNYTTADVKYAYLTSDEINQVKANFAANKSLPTALDMVLKAKGGDYSLSTAGAYKVAYLVAIDEGGKQYIYRVADNYYTGSGTGDFIA